MDTEALVLVSKTYKSEFNNNSRPLNLNKFFYFN
jgi:hypothetical protein